MAVGQWVRRVGLAAAAGCVAVAVAPAGLLLAADVEAGRPAAWGGRAAANGVFFTADQRPSLSPIVEMVYGSSPEGESTFDSSGTAEGRASSYYAGAGGSNAGSVLCLAGFPCPAGFPPAYPLSATASHPSKPDAQPQLSGNPFHSATKPAGLVPGEVRAHADRRYVETVSSVTGLTSPAGTARAVTATTRQEFVKGVLTVTAESVVEGLSVGGGALTVDTVRAVSVSRADGKRLLGDESTVVVTGARLGGQPAVIDDRGVHVAGTSNNAVLTAANAALAQLKSQGLSVRLVGVDRELDRTAGTLRVQASGLLVGYRRTVSGVPQPPGLPPQLPGVPNPNREYFGTVTFAAAGTSVFADDTRFEEPPVVVEPFVPSDPGSAPVVDVPVDPGGLGSVPVAQPPASTPGAPRAALPRLTPTPGARKVSFGLLPASVAERLQWLYGALFLTVVAAVAGGRLRAPARLPRAGA
jgi:hypothetical protein